MALTWTGWQPDPHAASRTPYVDWYIETDLRGTPAASGIEVRGVGLPGQARTLLFPAVQPAAAGGPPIADKYISGHPVSDVPLPAFAWPPQGTPPATPPVPTLTTPPPADAVIVGIIDTALAPAHERFRLGAGTRFLCAWQQGAAYVGQTWLPFGREIDQADIDAAMAAHADEDAVNRALGLVKVDHARGDRSLALRASHGTHVLDLAAGFDPARPPPEAWRLPIIGVTLPTGLTVGSSGTFLEFFVIHAIDHIVARADALWRASGHPASAKGAQGWPIVINLSYALAAGPKDGTSRIESFVTALVNWRRSAGLSPLRVVMPAGNDNLGRGHATLDFADTGDLHGIDWRVQPEDRSSNHAEIWSDIRPGTGATAKRHPFAVSVVPPGGPALTMAQGQDGQMCSLIDGATGRPVARLYCRKADDGLLTGTPKWHRFVYVLCVAPTGGSVPAGSGGAPGPEAPAGAWRIALTRKATTSRAILFVQTDQSLTLTGSAGRLSYFDHPGYRTVDDAGRRIDSASYPLDGAPPADTDGPGPVTRHNTLNALAGSPVIVTVSSYRASDGRPADYASTGRGFPRGSAASGPVAAMPSDDGYALSGLIGAGSQSGSALAIAGTSVATALATRRIAWALLGWHACGGSATSDTGNAAWLAKLAATAEASAGFPGRITAAKSGAGRIPAPETHRIGRRS